MNANLTQYPLISCTHVQLQSSNTLNIIVNINTQSRESEEKNQLFVHPRDL